MTPKNMRGLFDNFCFTFVLFRKVSWDSIPRRSKSYGTQVYVGMEENYVRRNICMRHLSKGKVLLNKHYAMMAYGGVDVQYRSTFS
jgi:hypothetical protein